MSEVYQDMDLLFYNSPMMTYSMELMTDEVIQADTNDIPITVDAKRKQKKFIEKFFDDIKLYDLIRPTILDIIQYGNAGWLLSFDEKGVDGI